MVTHARKALEANIAELKLAISDQNLDLLPDYEQRIEVLKELKFIDDNSTVLLKGRVACEVRRCPPSHSILRSLTVRIPDQLSKRTRPHGAHT